jgi:hypothetical protein
MQHDDVAVQAAPYSRGVTRELSKGTGKQTRPFLVFRPFVVDTKNVIDNHGTLPSVL